MENKLDLFAIVELFGHQKIAGKVSEHTVGSATFIRVDVPAINEQPSFTRLLNPSAIYAINPVTESVATAKAQQLKTAPIEAWDIREMHQKLLALGNRQDTDNEEELFND